MVGTVPSKGDYVMDTQILVRNNTKFIFVPGDNPAIPPLATGKVPQPLTETEFFKKLHAKGDVSFAGEAPAPRVESPAGVPATWSTMHVNACFAWIRRCSDVGVLTEISEHEQREKVLAALEARVTELEAPAQ